MKTDKIKKIPYGISDYHSIRLENYYYVDKTIFLSEIENAGKYLFFIRPRRFGKSLLLSVMEAYYDVLTADKFEFYFSGTEVYNDPTEERNSYLILKLDFSQVPPDLTHLEDFFLDHIREKAKLFFLKYKKLLRIENDRFIKEIFAQKSSSDILQSLFDLCRLSEYEIFVLIDEYDYFLNTLLLTSGIFDKIKQNHSLLFFYSFFNSIKAGTTGSNAPVARFFATGISSVTTDDVTGGFNIARDISNNPYFNAMIGFTKNDVLELIKYYRNAGMIKHEAEHLVEKMTRWYNNYRFATRAPDGLYKSDMVLYFFDKYFKVGTIPDDIIDETVRRDYDKLRNLLLMDKSDNEIQNATPWIIKEIIEKGSIISNVVNGFTFEEIARRRSLISLLYYFGLLTISGVERDIMKLSIPNESIKRLFYDKIENN